MEERHDGININIGLIVQIVLIVLKLGGALNCSWWVIFTPIWVSLGITVLCFIVLGIIVAISYFRGWQVQPHVI